MTLVLNVKACQGPPAKPGYKAAGWLWTGAHLHAVQGGAAAADDAVAVGTSTAWLREGPVTLAQQLASQPQVLPPQCWGVPSLGILPQQLAAPTDILGPKLWKCWCAVRVVSAESGGRAGSRHRTEEINQLGAEGRRNEVCGSEWSQGGKNDR